jgi:hypothetical protein
VDVIEARRRHQVVHLALVSGSLQVEQVLTVASASFSRQPPRPTTIRTGLYQRPT